MRSVVARVLIVGLLASSAGALSALATPTAADAASTSSMESQFVSRINAARAANGLRPYSVASDLTSVARSHSQQMASRDSLYHNPSLTTDVHNWRAVGENVGEGQTVSGLHTAFMNSPEHRANILDHDFTQVGVGVAVDGHGTVWVTEDFREPTGATSTSAGQPTTSTPAAAPAPVPRAVIPHPARRAGTPSGAAPGPPRQRLLSRLRHLRSTAPPVRPVDPVAQAFDYVSTVEQLAG